jgi:hypothetical protein
MPFSWTVLFFIKFLSSFPDMQLLLWLCKSYLSLVLGRYGFYIRAAKQKSITRNSFEIESLSKTTKYEDESVLDNFCRLYWLLNVSFHMSLFMNTDRNSGPDPDKTTKHQTISRLCYFAFVAVRSARRILPKYSSQRKQKNEDGIWIHVSLFCPVQDTDFGQYL